MHAFVNIFVESPMLDAVVKALADVSNVEELYEVTGEFNIVALIAATDIKEFRDTLNNKIMKIPGVKSTISSIVPQAHQGPKCEG